MEVHYIYTVVFNMVLNTPTKNIYYISTFINCSNIFIYLMLLMSWIRNKDIEKKAEREEYDWKLTLFERSLLGIQKLPLCNQEQSISE